MFKKIYFIFVNKIEKFRINCFLFVWFFMKHVVKLLIFILICYSFFFYLRFIIKFIDVTKNVFVNAENRMYYYKLPKYIKKFIKIIIFVVIDSIYKLFLIATYISKL